MTVALRDRSELVHVEIVSISKAGRSLKAKGIWPLIGKMQKNFFDKQMDALQEVAKGTSTNESLPRYGLQPMIP